MNKKIKLQQREYIGVDGITKYKQCRINIPHEIIEKMGWKDQDQIIISIESSSSSTKRKNMKRIVLKNKD